MRWVQLKPNSIKVVIDIVSSSGSFSLALDSTTIILESVTTPCTGQMLPSLALPNSCLGWQQLPDLALGCGRWRQTQRLGLTACGAQTLGLPPSATPQHLLGMAGAANLVAQPSALLGQRGGFDTCFLKVSSPMIFVIIAWTWLDKMSRINIIIQLKIS